MQNYSKQPNPQIVNTDTVDQSIINLQPAIHNTNSSTKGLYAYDKVALVLESSYRTIDFLKNPTTILCSTGNTSTSVIMLLRYTSQDVQIATMAQFIQNNTKDVECFTNSLKEIIEDFCDHNGRLRGRNAANIELTSGFAAADQGDQTSYLYSVSNAITNIVQTQSWPYQYSLLKPGGLLSSSPELQTSVLAYKNSGIQIILGSPSSFSMSITMEDPQFNNAHLAQVVKTLSQHDTFTSRMQQQREAVKSKEKANVVDMETIGKTMSYGL